jgi:hypothetical protein
MGLLIRSPWRIPNDGRVWWAWIILWVLSLLLVTLALLILYPAVGPFEQWMKALGRWLDDSRSWTAVVFIALGVVVLAVRAWTTKPIKNLKLKLPLGLFILGAIILFVPTPVLTEARVWAAVGTAVVGYVTATVLVPYIGDIVQYVRATPGTVRAREAIRTRGLELLRKIHDKGEYDRIVLVGHSLGCFVAYDLLQLIWQERGPSPKNGWTGMTTAQRDALHKVDGHVRALNPLDGSAPSFDPTAYDDAQAELRVALAAGRKWIISDFVTLGSPIAHSAFLTHDDGDAVAAGLAERMLSASPPRPDAPNNSMFYYAGDDKNPWPHHAAVFCAVRWTNIFDHAPFPAFGDVVSGEIDRNQFGPGVRNEKVEIRRGSVPLWCRRFTHTEYWRLTNGTWLKPDDHVEKLRAALNLTGK